MPRRRFIWIQGGCKILQIAFVYRIIKSDKSQEIWLSDFDGHTHLIKTIPAAIDYGDLTYTVEFTFPEYTWTRYDIVTNFRRELSTDIYETTGGRLWNMSLAGFPPSDPPYEDSGSGGGGTSTYTGRYTCDHPYGDPPPTPSFNTGSVEVDIANLVIPGYSAGEDGFGPENPIPSRPSTGTFVAAGSDDENFPFQIGWGDLADTGGTYDALFDGDGNLISAQVPYYFSSEDEFYWAEALTGNPIPNPGGIGTTGLVYRTMRGVSSFRYRNFDGDIEFSVPPGQSRPSPVNTPAEVEVYLSYSNGILQTLVRDTGRLNPSQPGQDCQPGVEGGDYFVSISKHELVDGVIQESTTIPNWMGVFDSPGTVNDILFNLDDSGDIGNELYRYIVNLFLNPIGSLDFLINFDEYIPVPNPDIISVYGWEIEVEGTGNIENIVLGTADNEGFSYFVYPVQVDLDQYPVPPYVGRGGGSESGDSLPINGSVGVNQIKATLSVPTIEGITADNFDVMAVVPSWGENTLEHCLDLTQIVPLVIGGS